MRTRRDELEDNNLLELTPVRVAAWEEIGGRVVVRRPPPASRGLRALLDRLLHLLSVGRIRLDERGSFVWKLLDGAHTVGQVANAARQRFGDAVEPAEERVGSLVRMLRHQALVAYPGWDDGVTAPPDGTTGS